MGNCANKRQQLLEKKFYQTYDLKTGHPQGGDNCRIYYENTLRRRKTDPYIKLQNMLQGNFDTQKSRQRSKSEADTSKSNLTLHQSLHNSDKRSKETKESVQNIV